MTQLQAGLQAQVERVVTGADTAVALGSGDVEVLATPRLLAWLEAATVEATAAALPAGSTSVGMRVEVQHERASAKGALVRATAVLVTVDGRLLHFTVAAEGGDGTRLAAGAITRAIVDRGRFEARVQSSASE